MKIKFQTNKMKFKRPNYNEEICLSREKTYSLPIYIPIKVKYKDRILTECETNNSYS
jgi:hypothetical protein